MKKLLLIISVLLFSFAAFSQANLEYGVKVGRGSDVPVIKKITTDGKNIEFYVGAKKMNPISSDTISVYSIPIIPLIYTAAGDTSNYPVPGKAGNIFINTSDGKVYISKTATRNGWLILN